MLHHLRKVIGFTLLSHVVFNAQADWSIYHVNEDSYAQYGDIMAQVLPFGAFATTLLIGDTDGSWQMGKAGLSTFAITHLLKKGFARTRPDDSSENSFPSGHTASAFVGAAFIHHRYGDKWAVPMYLLAGSVGFSRIYANRHFVDDVLAGATIGVFNSLMFTTPYQDSSLQLMPTIGEDSIGFQGSYAFGQNHKSTQLIEQASDFDYQYDLFLGKTFNSNHDTDQLDTHHIVDYKNSHHTSIQITQKWFEHIALQFKFTPFSVRTNMPLDDDFIINGANHTKDTPVVHAFDSYALGTHAAYDFLPKTNWIVQLGSGVLIQRASLNIENEQEQELISENHFNVYYELFAKLGYQFLEDFELSATVTQSFFTNDVHQTGLAQLSYHINPRWVASIFVGHDSYQDEFKTAGNAFKQKIKINYGGISMGYRF
jgi:hypothetical protein